MLAVTGSGLCCMLLSSSTWASSCPYWWRSEVSNASIDGGFGWLRRDWAGRFVCDRISPWAFRRDLVPTSFTTILRRRRTATEVARAFPLDARAPPAVGNALHLGCHRIIVDVNSRVCAFIPAFAGSIIHVHLGHEAMKVRDEKAQLARHMAGVVVGGGWQMPIAPQSGSGSCRVRLAIRLEQL